MTISRSTPVADWPELLRAEEVATVLSCSVGLVYEMARRNELPSIRIGRLLRVRRADLAKLVGAETAGDE